MLAYDALEMRLRKLPCKYYAPEEWERLEEAAEALKTAAPDLWRQYREGQFDADINAMDDAEEKMSQTAPAEWAEYRAANAALNKSVASRIKRIKQKQYVEF